MTLDELNKIERAAKKAENCASYIEAAREALANHRTEGRTIGYVLKKLEEESSYRTADQMALDELRTVLEKQQQELLRLAEMSLAAKQRAEIEKSRLLRSQIAAYLTEPERTEDPL